MERTPVNSTMINAVGYEPETQTLEIEFRKGGTYQYAGVGSAEYDAFIAAESQGKYFLANIKEKYFTTKL